MRTAKVALEYEVRFRYGPEPDAPADGANAKQVLFYEETFRNTGPAELTFSTWRLLPWVSSVRPASALERETMPVREGRGPPPVPEDIVRVSPGQSHTRSGWVWPERRLPFASARRGQVHDLFRVPQGKTVAAVKLVMCTRLVDDEALRALLKPGERLVEATVCSRPVELQYRVTVDEPD